MKSSVEQIVNRGFARQSTIDKMKDLTIEELYSNINSSVAERRTSSIRILSLLNNHDENHFIDIILERLKEENKLYTKTEICNTLEKSGEKAASKMVKHLGKIGNNQHKIIPSSVSKKKSYPLPRDIIARSLGRMYPSALASLLNTIEHGERIAILEAIDAYGFMAFYNPKLNTDQNCDFICNIIKNNENDDLIVWKCTLCLSAFPLKQSIQLLKKLEREHSHPIIKAEATRSLNLVNK